MASFSTLFDWAAVSGSLSLVEQLSPETASRTWGKVALDFTCWATSTPASVFLFIPSSAAACSWNPADSVLWKTCSEALAPSLSACSNPSLTFSSQTIAPRSVLACAIAPSNLFLATLQSPLRAVPPEKETRCESKVEWKFSEGCFVESRRASPISSRETSSSAVTYLSLALSSNSSTLHWPALELSKLQRIAYNFDIWIEFGLVHNPIHEWAVHLINLRIH